ncbi:hypothetical protein C0J52_19866 [Blattella germanica]|nr:hypothetical protein C0J52_19866 [Blattella germanica]
MKDPKDASKLRCLCPDKTVPKQGSCKHSRTGLHARCNNNEECIENAECKMPTNSTSNYKACICKEGFDEEDHACNGGIPTAFPSPQSGFLLLLFPVLQLIRN